MVEYLSPNTIKKYGNPVSWFNPYKRYPKARYGTDVMIEFSNGVEAITTKITLRKRFPDLPYKA